MSKQASYKITLPPESKFVFVRDVPINIPIELEPRSSLEFSETKQAAIIMEHREAIKNASLNGDLIVRNYLSKIQQPFAIGDQLDRSILFVDELGDYLSRFGIAVEVAEPAINSGRYTLEDAAKTLGKATRESEKIFLGKLKKVVADKSLPVYWPGSKVGHESLNVRDWVDEAYWDDLYTWLETSFPRIDWRSPKPFRKINKVYTEKSPGEPFSSPPPNSR